MHPAQRITAAVALIAAPLLLATGEFLRLQVEGSPDYTQSDNDIYRAQIDAIAANHEVWFLHGIAVFLGTLAWALAVVAIVAIVGRSRPILALVGGMLGLASALAHGAHLGFYTVMLSVLAGMPAEERDAGVAAWAGAGGDALGNALVLVFIVTFMLAPLVLAFGLWRGRVVPWWAFTLFVIGQLLMAGAPELVLGLGQLLWVPTMLLAARRFGRASLQTTVEPRSVPA